MAEAHFYKIEPADWFILRTPLLSIEVWLNWMRVIAALPTGPAGREAIKESFRHLFTPVVQEALFLSSQSMYEAVDAWLNSGKTQRHDFLVSKLVTQIARMAGRPTPFGLSAGISFGRTGPRTSLSLGGQETYRTRTRLDIRYLNNLAYQLGELDSIRSATTYQPNTTLYRHGPKYRYVEFSNLCARRLVSTRRLSACEVTPAIAEALKISSHGASMDQLIHHLAGSTSALGQAREFVGSLIDSQILVSDLEPKLTVEDPGDEFARRLRGLDVVPGIANSLDSACKQLQMLDADPIGRPIQKYREIIRHLRSVAPLRYDTELLHVDLIKPSPALQLGMPVLAEIAEALEVLHKMSRPQFPFIERFKADFAKRFGEREIPLLNALDEEAGLKLSKGLSSDIEPGFALSPDISNQLAERDSALLHHVVTMIEGGSREIDLSDCELNELKSDMPGPLLPSFSVLATLIARSNADVDSGAYRVLVRGYLSTGDLVSRFSFLDNDLKSGVETVLRREDVQCPDAIHAEIVHYPTGETLGNVLCHPKLGEFEIPLRSQSDVPKDNQILPGELRVSLVEGRFVLRSARLNKRVIPRVGNAHRFTNDGNYPLYQFLCGVSLQDCRDGPVWDWGPVLDSLPFLPRVTFGNVVFSRARWRVQGGELQKLWLLSPSERCTEVRVWMKRHRIPRYVLSDDSGRQVPLDLENPFSLSSWLRSVRDRDTVKLSEMFPDFENLCVTSPDGRFTHEMILPFLVRPLLEKPKSNNRQSLGRSTAQPQFAKRCFIPGSEWLSLKIYCSPADLDEILIQEVKGIIDRSESQKLTDSWFFLRYSDPDHHLRVRFHCPNGTYNQVLDLIRQRCEELVKEERIIRIEIDTYEREVKRYGGWSTIAAAEEIFCADSRAVLDFLRTAELANFSERFRFAIEGVDAFLECLDVNLSKKRSLLFSLRNATRGHYSADVEKVQLKIIAEVRAQRSHLLDRFEHRENHPRSEILQNRTDHIRATIKATANPEAIGQILYGSLPSFLHLHINRALRDNHWYHEIILYDTLYRIYDSLHARTLRAQS